MYNQIIHAQKLIPYLQPEIVRRVGKQLETKYNENFREEFLRRGFHGAS